METQLNRIRVKLDQLRSADPDLGLFGAAEHGYRLNPVLPEPELRRLEQEFRVTFPAGYAAFLTTIGDGGAGPFYGLERLESSCIKFFDDSENARHQYFDLAEPFPFTTPWNVEEELAELEEQIDEAAESGDTELEESLFEKKWQLIGIPELDRGRIQLCNYGCGTYISLIVNGPDKGIIWTDDRTNDGGLYPSTELGHNEKTEFLDWYETWLDQGLEKTGAA